MTGQLGETEDAAGRPVPARVGAVLSGSEAFSWEEALGGWRGVVESLLPPTLFLLAWVPTRATLVAALVAGGAAALLVVLRLASRQPLTQAFAGVVGVGVGVVWAVASGRSENYFAVGLITAAIGMIAVLATLVLRRSAVSIAVSMLWELPEGWRTDLSWAPLRRRCTTLTWLWFGLFALRLAVELPLWWAGEVAGLGVAKLVLGLPPFALVAWLTWAGLRPFAPARTPAEG